MYTNGMITETKDWQIAALKQMLVRKERDIKLLEEELKGVYKVGNKNKHLLIKEYREDLENCKKGAYHKIHHDQYVMSLTESIVELQDEIARKNTVIAVLQDRLKSEKTRHP